MSQLIGARFVPLFLDFYLKANLGHPMMDAESFTIFQMLVADGTNTLLPLDELAATKGGHLRFDSSFLLVIR
jgi:hypothetical protein